MLSIGQFSKLCLVTTKTLRHYDLIGLLKPIELNEDNGYRFYGVEQLDTMLKIMRLKDYGFSLEEIKALLNCDDGVLNNTLNQKLRDIENNLLILTENCKRLKNDIKDLKRGLFMKNQFDISLTETKPVNIASVREVIAIKDFGKLMEKLYALGLPCEGPPVAIYHCPDYNPEETDVEVGFPTSVKNENTRILDGGLCVKGLHYGDYGLLHESYLKMGKWIEENGYKIIAAPYERYLNDPACTPKDKLLTELYFPVKK